MRTLCRIDPVQDVQLIHKKLYDRFDRMQQHEKKMLSERQQQILREKMRKLQIEARSSKEIIMHPCNNGHWINLAGFLNSSPQPDLDQIEQRRQERRKIRDQFERKKEEAIDQKRTDQLQNNKREKMQKQKEKSKIPWRLMRELRKKQVEQNKLRNERMEQLKRAKMNNFHKY